MDFDGLRRNVPDNSVEMQNLKDTMPDMTPFLRRFSEELVYHVEQGFNSNREDLVRLAVDSYMTKYPGDVKDLIVYHVLQATKEFEFRQMTIELLKDLGKDLGYGELDG